MAVKVILREDVSNLGQAGDIKQVTPGYFRNFLLPRGLAVEATTGQMRAVEQNKSVMARRAAKTREQTGTLASQLADTTIRIPVRVGEQGRLYGSVTNKDLADALAAQSSITIDRHKIDLQEPLRSVGVHSVPIRLDQGVEAHVNVELVPEESTSE